MKSKKYEKHNFEEQVKNSTSYADLATKIGLAPKGGNYKTLKKYIELYNLDVSHFNGSAWNKGMTYSETTSRIPLEAILQKGTNYRSSTLKKRLIKEGLKEYKCEKCGITNWNGDEIVLELHHINGNHFDNRLENLQILCPNCHSQTPTHRGKDGKKYTNTIKTYFEDTEIGYKKKCPICGTVFVSDRENRKYCSRKCYNDSLRENEELHITEDTLKQAIPKCNSITDIAKYFDVSRPTIRKHLERYDLINLIKEKYDFHAKPIIQYTMNGELVKEWPSAMDAEKITGIDEVGRVANFKRKSAGGYVWRWKK